MKFESLREFMNALEAFGELFDSEGNRYIHRIGREKWFIEINGVIAPMTASFNNWQFTEFSRMKHCPKVAIYPDGSYIIFNEAGNTFREGLASADILRNKGKSNGELMEALTGCRLTNFEDDEFQEIRKNM
jgi:hypothetical protein